MTGGRGGVGGGLAAEKLEILWGSRGNPREWALRRGELVDVQKLIADMRKSLDDLKKALTQVKDDVDALTITVAELEDQIDGLEARIADAEESLDALEGVIAEIEGRLTSIDASILGLQADVSALQSDVGNVAGDVTNLQVDVAHLQTDLVALAARVTSAEGDIADLQADLNGLEGDVSTLQANAMSRYALQSNPGANPFDPGIEAIPLYTNGELTGGITLTGNQTFTVPVSGLYMFEVEVRIDGGAVSMPPLGTAFALSIDTITVPTVPRPGYSVSDVVRAMTITRLVCVERLAPGAQRVAYFLNQGAAAYQVTSAVVKITRISA